MVLECPVHIDTAAFTIFNVVLIEGSTLRTLCHMLLLLILTLLVFWHYVAPPAGGHKGPHTTSAPPPPLRDDLPSLAGSLTHYHALANFQGDTGECWCMAEHVCIGGICQGTIALTSFDAAAQLVGLCSPPCSPKIVVMLAQVAHRLGTNTARPYIAIGGDLSRGNPCQAGNDLAFLDERALDDVVVAIAKRLRDARDAVELGFANVALQAFDDGLVLLDGRRNTHTHRIQFDALFRDLADERVGLHFLVYEMINVLKLVYIEV